MRRTFMRFNSLIKPKSKSIAVMAMKAFFIATPRSF
jgi:hypothetical protein